MGDTNLPDDLVAYLKSGKRPKYNREDCECGNVTLRALDKLKTELFAMQTEYDDDPHADERWESQRGCYLVRSVSLIETCEYYDPSGVLVWLPIEQQYGQFDAEHETLHVFAPNVVWTDIAKNLPRYANAEWGGYPNGDDAEPTAGLKPWDNHPYSRGSYCGALPDISEWYRVSWDRRGEFEAGVQLRHYEEIAIRIERDGERCAITADWQKPEEGGKLQTTMQRCMTMEEWASLRTDLALGFWSANEFRCEGEVSTSWSVSGFSDGQYKSLFRSYDAKPAENDATHILGKRLASLAQLEHRIIYE